MQSSVPSNETTASRKRTDGTVACIMRPPCQGNRGASLAETKFPPINQRNQKERCNDGRDETECENHRKVIAAPISQRSSTEVSKRRKAETGTSRKAHSSNGKPVSPINQRSQVHVQGSRQAVHHVRRHGVHLLPADAIRAEHEASRLLGLPDRVVARARRRGGTDHLQDGEVMRHHHTSLSFIGAALFGFTHD